jgi:hypothetical protein
MGIQIFDPVGELEVVERRQERAIKELAGLRVGFIFNQHTSAQRFWRTLETEVEASLRPAAVHRVHKDNTWAPAPKDDLERILQETDYALIGVGA